jgi:hypothetical protein
MREYCNGERATHLSKAWNAWLDHYYDGAEDVEEGWHAKAVNFKDNFSVLEKSLGKQLSKMSAN